VREEKNRENKNLNMCRGKKYIKKTSIKGKNAYYVTLSQEKKSYSDGSLETGEGKWAHQQK